MAKAAGDALNSSTVVIGLPDSDADTTAGQAVTLSSGDLAAADSTNSDALVGIRSSNRMAGDTAPVVVGGITVANVGTNATAGLELDVGTTAGELVETAGGPVVALTDEAGTWKGAALPAGTAAVRLR